MSLIEPLHVDGRISKVVPWKLSDTPITMCRNRCVAMALQTQIDYLLMVDSDMSPDCQPGAPLFWDTAWEFMMSRRPMEDSDPGLPPATIAAPYCGPGPHENVYIFRWSGNTTGDPSPSWKLCMYDRDDASRQSGIQEVAALPTGLILYDVRVFKKLPPPWFDYEWDEPCRSQKLSTEDVFQTRNAALIGLPQFVAWDCWAGHVKLETITKPRPLTIVDVRKEYAKAIKRFDEQRSHAGLERYSDGSRTVIWILTWGADIPVVPCSLDS
jgi:hypothetical protein